MPPIAYSRLATKDDLNVLRGEMTLMSGELQLKMANQLRVFVAMHITTTLALFAFVAAST